VLDGNGRQNVDVRQQTIRGGGDGRKLGMVLANALFAVQLQMDLLFVCGLRARERSVSFSVSAQVQRQGSTAGGGCGRGD
jgi:hypothetical protein